MNGTLEFLLSPEERDFFKAVKKTLNAQGVNMEALFEQPVTDNDYLTINYAEKAFFDVLHDMVILVHNHIQEFSRQLGS
jgi:hypothetical protein